MTFTPTKTVVPALSLWKTISQHLASSLLVDMRTCEGQSVNPAQETCDLPGIHFLEALPSHSLHMASEIAHKKNCISALLLLYRRDGPPALQRLHARPAARAGEARIRTRVGRQAVVAEAVPARAR